MLAIRRDCQPELIDRFVTDALSEPEQSSLEAHLEDCPRCRQLLDRKSATDGFWQAAAARLHTDEFGPHATTPEESREQADLPTSSFNDATTVLRNWLAPTDDPTYLGRLGTYEILGVVNRGGMGWILRGFDRAIQREVAIKTIAPQLADHQAARQRFAREARAAAAVVHENVLTIHAVDQWRGVPYLVMPYVRGESLQQRLNRQDRFELAEILQIGRQVAAGLQAAHDQGVVHRDIKPANILLSPSEDRIFISDFGLARLADDASVTHTGLIAGTPQYMSPEQATGRTVDDRTDLFSLGSVLYTLCCAEPPFRAETPYGVLTRIANDTEPPIRKTNPEIPRWLCSIIQRLMHKDPQKRLQSAAEVEKLLAAGVVHIRQPETHPLPDALAKLSDHASRASRFKVGAFVTGLVVVLAGLIGSLGWFGNLTDNPSNSTNRISKSNLSTPSATHVPNQTTVQPGAEPKPTAPPLRFKFHPDRQLCYSVSISAKLDDFEVQATGYLIYSVESVLNDHMQLRCENSLMAELKLVRTALPRRGSLFTLLGSVDVINQLPRESRLTVTSLGQVTDRAATCELPFCLGGLAELLLFPVSDPATSNWTNEREWQLIHYRNPVHFAPPHLSSANLNSITVPLSVTSSISGWSKEDGIATVKQRRRATGPKLDGRLAAFEIDGQATIHFDTNLGVCRHLSLHHIVSETEGSLTQRVGVQVEIKQIQPAEIQAIQQQHQQRKLLIRQEAAGPFNRAERRAMLRQMAAGTHLLMWLQRIDQKRPSAIDEEILAVVRPLQGHRDPHISRLAAAILKKFPESQSSADDNPFRPYTPDQ